MTVAKEPLVSGIDGCKGGWVVIRLRGAKHSFVGDFLGRQDGCVDDGAFVVTNWSHFVLRVGAILRHSLRRRT